MWGRTLLSPSNSTNRNHTGVVQLVLFDTAGQIIADRLVFTRKPELLAVDVRKSKESYQPFERVTLDFSVRDTTGIPVSAPMSVSIRDGWEEVESRHSMLVDLLLMSEIKGYVHRPLYYFEVNDMEHRLALDCLLMVRHGDVINGSTQRV